MNKNVSQSQSWTEKYMGGQNGPDKTSDDDCSCDTPFSAYISFTSEPSFQTHRLVISILFRLSALFPSRHNLIFISQFYSVIAKFRLIYICMILKEISTYFVCLQIYIIVLALVDQIYFKRNASFSSFTTVNGSRKNFTRF